MRSFLLFLPFFLVALFYLHAQNTKHPIYPTAAQQAELREYYFAEHLQTVLASQPNADDISLDLSPNFIRKGYQQLERGALNQAREAFETFLVLAPEEAIAYYGMADYYYIMQDYRRASFYYEEAAARGLPRASAQAENARIAQLYYELEENKEGWD